MQQIVELKQSTIEVVNKYPIRNEYYDFTEKPELMILELQKIYEVGKKQLKGLFNMNEVLLMLNSFISGMYPLEFNWKSVVLMEIEDFIELSGADKLYDVNKYELLRKLKELSELQGYALIRMIFEALYVDCNELVNKDFRDNTKEIFGIIE